jgi:uncharacterized repeat protein (TIGR01451 family)
MIRKNILFFILLTLLCGKGKIASGQLVGTSAYLQGNFVEVGICPNGSFGAIAPPVGYHPHCPACFPSGGLSMVCDYGRDGWAVGSPASMGDYTLAGSPFEGWELQANGSRVQGYQSGGLTFSYSGPGTFTSSGIGSYLSTPLSKSASINGIYNPGGGQLYMNMETHVDTGGLWVTINVKLKNIGSSTINNIYFFRSCDPDIDETWPGGSFVSDNWVTYQNDVVHRVLVSAKGALPGAYMGLGAIDSRAVAMVYNSWGLSSTFDLASGWAMNTTFGGTSYYGAGVHHPGDIGIGLVAKLGNLAPGDSTTYSYAYIFGDSSNLDRAITTACSGTPVAGGVVSTSLIACPSTPISLSDTGSTLGSSIQWQTSPDSTTWSSIPGATGSTYSFVGIGANTFYRAKATCPIGGGAAQTAGIQLLSFPCCTGMPVAGTASTGTTYCSACTLTLNLAGCSIAPNITYQWQSSPDNITWSGIPGGTTTAFTFAPGGAYYYRCLVTCTTSSLFAYSNTIFVPYHYLIIADSTRHGNDSSCISPSVYVKVNGWSPLLYMKTYYGDGTKDSIPLIRTGGEAYNDVTHNYTCSGHYTIKQILYSNNVPQDSVTYTYLYHFCRTLPITLFFDTNLDCIMNSTEHVNSVPTFVKVDSNGVPVDTISVTAGLHYTAYGSPGTVYSFSVLSSNLIAICPVSGAITDTIRTYINTYPTKAFGLTCSTGPACELSVSAVVPVTGGHDQWGNIYVHNNFCAPTDAGLTMHYSPKYGSPNTRPTASTIFGNTIIWNMTSISNTDLHPVNLYYSIWSPPVRLTVGDTVNEDFTVTPVGSTDINLTNNIVIREDTVRAGCDPNFIAVSPSQCYASDTQLLYVIHFENVGNDTAHNVHILDTLSDNLDAGSLSIVESSHEMYFTKYLEGGHTVIKFDLPHANLLDSSQHGLCDGAIFFRINTLAGIPDGSEIFHKAGIYFDDNEVVMTNTAYNIKGCPDYSSVRTVAARSPIEIFPNPTTNELTIKTELNLFTSFTISNSMGQVLVDQNISGAVTKANVGTLAPGLYYVTLKGGEGVAVRKFVKM